MHRELKPQRDFSAVVLILLLLILHAGCSGSGSPLTPGTSQTSVQNQYEVNKVHSVLWYGAVKVDEINASVEFIPARQTLTHFNIRSFTEEGPCTDCLKLKNFEVLPGDIFSFDIQLSHPFPGLDQYTGFDVRGVVIFNGSEEWPSTDVTVPRSELGDGELLNADGYTRLYNPVEFPPGSMGIGLWEYSQGVLAPPGLLSGSLNGYKAYHGAMDRRIFTTTSVGSAHYEIKRPDGPFLFGYAVDASWLAADPSLTGDPGIIDVPGDFSLDANCPEAYQLSTSAGPGLINDGTGEAELLVDIYDWQDDADSAMVRVECPDLFPGLLPLGYESTGTDYTTFSGPVTNNLVALEGVYTYLVSVEDMFDSSSPLPLIAYQFGTIEVTPPMDFDPIAIADCEPYQQSVCEMFFFFDNGSYDPDGGDIVTYEWDWENDGIFDEEGMEVYHSWNIPGAYEVQFRVTDDEGATDTLDEPLQITIFEDVVPQPQMIIEITGTFHSPYCAKVDTLKDVCYVDCTQAAPILDFGFYKIDDNEQVTLVWQKIGAGFFGMPGMFGLDVEGRKLIAPDVLGAYPNGCPIDIWDVAGGPDLKFYIPILEDTQIAFCMDAEIFTNINTAVVCDSSPENRLVYWDYTDNDPVMNDVPVWAGPSMLEADQEGHRLFVYCGGGGENPKIEIWDAQTWTQITEFETQNVTPPFMSDMDYDPCSERLYFGSGGDSLEIWDLVTNEFVGEIHTGYGEVQGIDHLGTALYMTASDGAAGHLLVYDAITLELIWDVQCGIDPRVVAVNPNNRKIYIPDMSGQSVFVFQG